MNESQPVGKVVAVCVSDRKGIRKRDVGDAFLKRDWGLEGDAHAADWHRQVSLLAVESIDKMRAKGLKVNPGSFAENITVQGLDLPGIPIGTRVQLGEAEVEITQIGKICHTRCAIYHQAGDCVMPREGIFAKVLKEGRVQTGDQVEILSSPD
jgi:MOSC domain-containing protein YiiM